MSKPSKILTFGSFIIFLALSCLASESLGAAIQMDDEFDYFRLAHPEIADFIDLTDRQRIEISGLISQAAEASASVESEQRSEIMNQFRQKIHELLGEEQRQRLMELPELQKLRFNFVNPSWEEVLRWFARQADLSLVMGTVPSGEFNYTDSREYTPAQAIDLLNSILLTKGFTLVRRDKLLILVEIKDGIPDEILPRVNPEELSQRGTYEVVSVMFSLGDKPVDAVQAEIKPVLSSFGKAILLPNSKQLLVTETVGKLKAIKALIESVPSPKPPPAQKPAPPKEPSEVRAFSIGSLDPTTTIESLQALVPDTVISHDGSTRRIVIYGPVSKLKLAEGYLDQLRPTTDANTSQRYLRPYELIGQYDPVTLLEQLKLIVPQAELSFDTISRRLLVFGDQTQQQQVEETLKQLDIDTKTDTAHAVRVFKLRRANPTAATEVAKAVSPRATVTAAPESSAIIVRAAEAELAMIDSLIQQLEIEGTRPEDQIVLKTIECNDDLNSDFLATLQSLAPNAKLNFDPQRKVLVFIGAGEEFSQIEPLVETFNQQTAGAADRELVKFYPLDRNLVASAESLIKKMMPQLQLDWDNQTERFTVIASPTEHEKLAALLDQLVQDIPPRKESKLQIYSLSSDLKPRFNAILESYPDELGTVKIITDQRPGELAMIATPNEHELIGQIVRQLQAPIEGAEPYRIVSYSIGDSSPEQLSEFLSGVFTDAKIVIDEVKGRLMIWATQSMHEQIKTAIEQIRGDSTETETRTSQRLFRTYRLQSDRPVDLLPILQRLVPRMELVADNRQSLVVAWGRESDHEILNQAIDQFNLPLDPEGLTIQFYPADSIDPQQATLVLKQLLPEATIVSQAESKTLTVLATKQQQQWVEHTLEQMAEQGASAASLSIAVYQVPRTGSANAITLLKSILPNTQILPGTTPDRFVALAASSEHERLREWVQQLESNSQSVAGKQLKAYQLRADLATQVRTLLQSTFPGLVLIPVDNGRFATWAFEEEHAQVQSLIADAEQELTAEKKKYQTYPLGPIPAATARAELLTRVPNLSIIELDELQKLTVLASPVEHDQIAEVLAGLESLFENRSDSFLEVYRLDEFDLTLVIESLPKEWSQQMKIRSDLSINSLIVEATAEQHQELAKQLEVVKQKLPKVETPIARLYPMGNLGEKEWTALVTKLAPTATVVADSKTSNLVVTALPRIHQLLAEVAGDLITDLTTRRSVQVFSLNQADGRSLQTAMTSLLPNCTVTFDPGNKNLIVTGGLDDLAVAEQTIKQLDNRDGDVKLKSYWVTDVPAESMARSLRELFRNDPSVSVTAERGSRAVIAVANDAQHQMIESLLQQSEINRDAPDRMRQLKTFSLGQVNGTNLIQSLESLFETETLPPQISFDLSSNRLVTLATEEQLAIIEKALEDFTPPEQEFRVFRISSVEADSAATAIRSYFRPLPLSLTPTVEVDYDSQQLLIRATSQQMKEIESVLAELGETDLARLSQPTETEQPKPQQASSPNMRLLTGRQDWAGIVQQTNPIWSQLRQNPIQVVQPDDLEALSSTDVASDPAFPPIIALAETERLTLMSSDSEALDQLENLLKVLTRSSPAQSPMSSEGVATTKNFDVIPLKHAGAEAVATQLRQMYRELDRSRRVLPGIASGRTPVVFGSDERLNTLIVHGSRADRQTVRELVKNLDSTDVPITLLLDQPAIVPVTNTDANRIVTILNNIYKTQLSSGGGRKPVPIPEGISPEVASVLQQVNAATAGPLLTLGVDEVTNSIIVRAPEQLQVQIKSVIEKLDQAVATQPGQEIEIIQFKNSNPERIEKALDALLERRNRSRR